METSWTDGDNTLQIHNQQFGAWTLKITRKDVCDSLKIRLTDKELQEIIDMLQECIPITETKAERLADPKNPEDITAVEERYQNAAKTSDNLMGAINDAKLLYNAKHTMINIYVYNGDIGHVPLNKYLALSRDCVYPDNYHKILYIDGANVGTPNEEIVIHSL